MPSLVSLKYCHACQWHPSYPTMQSLVWLTVNYQLALFLVNTYLIGSSQSRTMLDIVVPVFVRNNSLRRVDSKPKRRKKAKKVNRRIVLSKVTRYKHTSMANKHLNLGSLKIC